MEQRYEKSNNEYDYMEITAKNEYETLYRESYPKFGWEEEGTSEAEYEINALTIKYRRNRKILNKIVLTRLQRQFETIIKEIVLLEKNKSFFAILAASILSILAAGIFTGAVFSFLGKLLALGIILSVLGCLMVSAAWLCFLLLKKRKIQQNRPLILRSRSEINELIGQAEKLL